MDEKLLTNFGPFFFYFICWVISWPSSRLAFWQPCKRKEKEVQPIWASFHVYVCQRERRRIRVTFGWLRSNLVGFWCPRSNPVAFGWLRSNLVTLRWHLFGCCALSMDEQSFSWDWLMEILFTLILGDLKAFLPSSLMTHQKKMANWRERRRIRVARGLPRSKNPVTCRWSLLGDVRCWWMSRLFHPS